MECKSNRFFHVAVVPTRDVRDFGSEIGSSSSSALSSSGGGGGLTLVVRIPKEIGRREVGVFHVLWVHD